MHDNSTSALAPRVQAVLERLYAETLQRDPISRRSAGAEHSPGFYQAMEGAYMPVTPDAGMLLYQLVRLARCRMVVEFGTSLGISSIYLAAALQANGGGQLITSEFLPAKATQARRNLEEAGLGELVAIRVGDAMQTLASAPPDNIDLLLLDGAKNLYLPLLKALEPNLRDGAVVVADNIEMEAAADCRGYLLDGRNGYTTAALATWALGSHHPLHLAVRRAAPGLI